MPSWTKHRLRLQHKTRHVVVVGGTSSYDRHVEALFRDRLRRYEKSLDIEYLTDLDMPTLLDRLAHLPPNTIILYTNFEQDAAGTPFIAASQADPMMAEAANAPIFTPMDVDWGHGEVGGDVHSFSEEGIIVEKVAQAILGGKRPQDIPITQGANVYLFDWRALRHWGFSEGDLPPGSIVRNRERTVWDAFKWYIIGSISLTVLETLLIGGLLWQRARRRKIEAELRQSEDKFSKAFRRSPLAFTLASLVDYRLVEVNDTFEHYTGWKRDEVIGRTPQDVGIWVDVKQRSTFIEQLRAQGAVRGMEILFRRKDGQVWTALVSSELIDLNGEPCALSLIADITEVKRAELVRRESEERFRLVANSAPVMIWMSGQDRLCTYFNQPWLEFTGRPLDAEVGNGWADGVHPEDLNGCLDTYTKSFDRHVPFKMEYRLRRNDGEYRWILDIGVPRLNPDRSFAGYIGSCLDITDLKLAQEALSSMSRRLIESQEQERSRIGRELHDDINQRLALLAVELDRLNQSGSTNGFQDILQESKRRVMEIARDVQALSHRLHSSKLEYLGLAAAANSFCREISEIHHVRIDFTQNGVPRNLPKEVALCLFRVLQEALQNAVKYSGSDHFEVELCGRSADVLLRVRDFGEGFSVDDAMEAKGLGLVSMRERVNLVKGEFVIKSKPMAGTEITVHVPLPIADRASNVTSGAA